MLNAMITKHLLLCTEKIEAHVARIAEQRENLDTCWRQLNNTNRDTTDEEFIKRFQHTVENVESSLKPTLSCCKTDTMELTP